MVLDKKVFCECRYQHNARRRAIAANEFTRQCLSSSFPSAGRAWLRATLTVQIADKAQPPLCSSLQLALCFLCKLRVCLVYFRVRMRKWTHLFLSQWALLSTIILLGCHWKSMSIQMQAYISALIFPVKIVLSLRSLVRWQGKNASHLSSTEYSLQVCL